MNTKFLLISFLVAASISGLTHAENRILTAQLTKGPYEVVADETDAYQKANITSLQDGVPIKYILTVTRNNVTLPNIRLDTWFANAAGLYSGVSSIGTADQDFLRGWQVTDENGQATFYGIFPGTYTGRTVHVHIRAREYAKNGTVIYNNTTQLFFPEEIITEVLKLDSYKAAAAKSHNTDNDHDMFYTTENMLTLTGDTTTGYIATATIELPLRETNQSSSDSEMGPNGPGQFGQGGQGGRGRPNQNNTMGPNGQGQFGGRNNSMGRFGGPNGTFMGSSNPASSSETSVGSSSYAPLVYFLGGLIVGGLFFAVLSKRRTKNLQSLINQEGSQDPLAQQYKTL